MRFEDYRPGDSINLGGTRYQFVSATHCRVNGRQALLLEVRAFTRRGHDTGRHQFYVDPDPPKPKEPK